MPYGSKLNIPPSNLLLLAAEQEPYKKAYLFLRRMDRQAEKKRQDRKRIGLGRRTRMAIVQWNQMTALRFQTGGETSDIPGLSSGVGVEYFGVLHELEYLLRVFRFSRNDRSSLTLDHLTLLLLLVVLVVVFS